MGFPWTGPVWLTVPPRGPIWRRHDDPRQTTPSPPLSLIRGTRSHVIVFVPPVEAPRRFYPEIFRGIPSFGLESDDEKE
jgi:hypothetical protein